MIFLFIPALLSVGVTAYYFGMKLSEIAHASADTVCAACHFPILCSFYSPFVSCPRCGSSVSEVSPYLKTKELSCRQDAGRMAREDDFEP